MSENASFLKKCIFVRHERLVAKLQVTILDLQSSSPPFWLRIFVYDKRLRNRLNGPFNSQLKKYIILSIKERVVVVYNEQSWELFFQDHKFWEACIFV